MKKLLVYLLTVFTITSCANFQEEQTDSTEEAQVLEAKEVSTIMKAGDCSSDTSVYCTKVAFNYPTYSGDSALAATINKAVKEHILKECLKDSVNAHFEEYTQQFIDDYHKIKSRFEQAFGWYSVVNSRQVRKDSTLLVIETSLSLYTGGAHGMDALYFLNFDVKTGKVLSLEDVFKAGFESQLNRLLIDEFNKVNEHIDTYDLKNEKLYSNNFGLLHEGLTFYYNAYEVAPYSSGATRVLIPYEDINEILASN